MSPATIAGMGTTYAFWLVASRVLGALQLPDMGPRPSHYMPERRAGIIGADLSRF